MASYAITDNGEYIDITDAGAITRSLKKKYITMSVDEPYLYLNVHEKELRPQIYQWKIDFNDVTSPVVASAADLETAIQLMITGTTTTTDSAIKLFKHLFLR